MSVKRQLAMLVMVLPLLQGANGEAKDDTVKAIKDAEEEVNLAFNRYDAFSTRFRATHVWAKRVGRWEMVSAHVSQMKD